MTDSAAAEPSQQPSAERREPGGATTLPASCSQEHLNNHRGNGRSTAPSSRAPLQTLACFVLGLCTALGCHALTASPLPYSISSSYHTVGSPGGAPGLALPQARAGAGAVEAATHGSGHVPRGLQGLVQQLLDSSSASPRGHVGDIRPFPDQQPVPAEAAEEEAVAVARQPGAQDTAVAEAAAARPSGGAEQQGDDLKYNVLLLAFAEELMLLANETQGAGAAAAHACRHGHAASEGALEREGGQPAVASAAVLLRRFAALIAHNAHVLRALRGGRAGTSADSSGGGAGGSAVAGAAEAAGDTQRSARKLRWGTRTHASMHAGAGAGHA